MLAEVAVTPISAYLERGRVVPDPDSTSTAGQYARAGLLLGYPPETTAALIAATTTSTVSTPPTR